MNGDIHQNCGTAGGGTGVLVCEVRGRYATRAQAVAGGAIRVVRGLREERIWGGFGYQMPSAENRPSDTVLTYQNQAPG